MKWGENHEAKMRYLCVYKNVAGTWVHIHNSLCLLSK